MGQIIRSKEIRRKRVRKAKLQGLRAKYEASKTKKDKDAVMAKVAVIAPWLSEEQFLSPLGK